MTGTTLRTRLLTPDHGVSVEELAQGWFQTDITLTVLVDRAPDVAADPGVTDRVRGALGRALMDGASAASLREEPCTFDPPCTHDVMWNPKGTVRRGVEIPKPFRLGICSAADDRLSVRVSLFGFASDWAEPVAEALVRAFHGGVALIEGDRCGWDVIHRTITTAAPLASPPFSDWDRDDPVGVVLAFQTPFAFRGRDRAPLDPLALLTGLSRRAEGMARWHDVHLQVGGQQLADAAAMLTHDASLLRPYHRLRPPNRGRSLGIPLDGSVGPYALFGPQGALASLWPLLVLGTAFGAGTRTSLGFGGYHLSVLTPDLTAQTGRSVENV